MKLISKKVKVMNETHAQNNMVVWHRAKENQSCALH